MRLVVLACVCLSIAACGSDAPTAPSTPAANLAAAGNLSVTGCAASSSNNLFNCLSFTGTATNSGSGCATNVRGVTTAFDAASKVQTGTSGWNYSNTVRPGEQFAYAGIGLLVAGPLSGGWNYTTTMSWDNVKCP